MDNVKCQLYVNMMSTDMSTCMSTYMSTLMILLQWYFLNGTSLMIQNNETKKIGENFKNFLLPTKIFYDMIINSSYNPTKTFRYENLSIRNVLRHFRRGINDLIRNKYNPYINILYLIMVNINIINNLNKK